MREGEREKEKVSTSFEINFHLFIQETFFIKEMGEKEREREKVMITML